MKIKNNKIVLFAIMSIVFTTYAQAFEWVSPTKEACEQNEGYFKKSNGGCYARWFNAEKICKAMDARTPPHFAVTLVALKCGVNSVSKEKNLNNKSYQSCYQKLGFLPVDTAYWDSPSLNGKENEISAVLFKTGRISTYAEHFDLLLRCVK